MPSLLAQRAASEGPRWTRAVEGNPAPSLRCERELAAARDGSHVGATRRRGWDKWERNRFEADAESARMEEVVSWAAA